MNFCLNPNFYENESLIESIGKEGAYHAVYLNNGHPLSKTPSGEESELFNSLYETTHDLGKALSLKSKFYTDSFFKEFGNWIENKSGEPKLADYIDKIGVNAVTKENEFVREQPTAGATEDSRNTYTPILNRLSKAFGLEWAEAPELPEAAAYADGKIYVNFDKITPDSAFHEYSHPIVQIIKKANPAAYNRLVAEANRYTDIVNQVKAKYSFSDQSKLNDEIITTVIGNYATQANEIMQKKGLIAAIKQFFTSVANMFNNVFGLKRNISQEQLSKLSLRELGFMVGVTPINLDLGQIEKAYNHLKTKGTEKNGLLTVELADYNTVQGYRDVFGRWNVYITESPKDQKQTYTVEIDNPLSTRGEFLYRKASTPLPKKEYVTTNEPLFDELIASLHEQIAAVKDELYKPGLPKLKRNRLYRDKYRFENTIDDVYRMNTLDEALQVVGTEVKRLEDNVKKEQGLTEIQSAIKLLNSFEIVNKYFDEEVDPMEITESINKILGKVSKLQEKYVKKLYEQNKKEMIEAGAPESIAQTMYEPTKDIGMLNMQLMGSSFSQNPLEQAVDRTIHKTAFENNETTRAKRNEIDKMANKFNGNFAFMQTRDTDGNPTLISKMNKNFVDTIEGVKADIEATQDKTKGLYIKKRELEKELAKVSGDTSEGYIDRIKATSARLKDVNNEIMKEKSMGKTWNDYHRLLQEHFDYELTDEKAEEYKEHIELLREDYYKLDKEGKLFFDSKGYERAVKRDSPYEFKLYLEGKRKSPNNGHRWYDLIPKADSTELYSKEYKSLTTEQKEFYDFFTDTFIEASGKIYNNSLNLDLSLDSAMREFMSMGDAARGKMKYSEAVKDWIVDKVAVKHGASESDVHGVFTGIGNKNIRSVSINGFIDPKKSLDKQDIVGVLKNYYSAGMAVQYKRKVEDLLNTSAEIAFHLSKIDTTSAGEKKKDIFGNEKTVPSESKIYKRIRHIVDNYLYDDIKENQLGTLDIKGVKVSGDRVVDMMNDFTRLRQMGLNPFSGLSNLLMGTINNWTYAAREEFYTRDDYRKAYLKLKSSVFKTLTLDKIENAEAKKIHLLAEKFGIHSQLMEKHGLNKVFDKAFIFQERGEYLNHMAVVLAILNSEKLGIIKDRAGNDKRFYDVFKVNGKELTLDNENFDLEALGINDKRIFTIIQGVSKINKEIHGDYDPLNPMYVKRTAMGRLVATFRTWLPQAIYQRFGAATTDHELSEMTGKTVERKGRYISLKDAIMKDKGKGALKFLGNLTSGLIPLIKGNYKTGGEFSDVDVANLNQTLTEMRTLIMISLGVMVMGKVHDDDDDQDKSWYNFIYNMTARTENELAFFYLPSNGYKVFKDVVPAVDTFTQLGKTLSATANKIVDPESDIYQKGYRKGTSKAFKELQLLLPGLKQVQNLWSTTSQMYNNTSYKR